MIQLRLGELPIALDPAPLFALLAQVMQGKATSPKERAFRIAYRGMLTLGLDWIASEIHRNKLPLPPPNCPRGMDLTEYGTRYLALMLSYLLSGKTFELDYEVSDDGTSIVIRGLAPATALPDGAPSAAAPGAALPAPARVTVTESSGPDRGEPVGSLVHPGGDGIGENEVRQAVAAAADGPLSDGQPVRAG